MFRDMRRSKQQLTDAECRELLSNEKRGALALNGDGGYPYAIPMDYSYDGDRGCIYFHGAAEGHKMDAMERDPKASFCVWEQGFIAPGDWAYTVRSVVVFGRLSRVEGREEKQSCLRTIGQRYYPSEELVEKEITAALDRVCVLRLDIEHMTGKLVHER